MQAPLSPDLVELPERIKKASGLDSDLVTTPDGQWAVQVRVGRDVATPVSKVEQIAGHHRVLYRIDSPRMTARPAFPERGE